MCRWLAYMGSPVLIRDALLTPKHSLIDQSLHSRLGAETTNGDGFGIGWYDHGGNSGGVPQHRARVERREPPRALRPHPLAAVLRPHPGRDRIAGAADELPPVPARPLAVHAQRVHRRVRADQARPGARSRHSPVPGDPGQDRHGAAVPRRADDRPRGRPAEAVARAIGLVEDVGARHGIKYPFQGTVATTDGERMWAFRYSSKGDTRSLFFSRDVRALRALYPDREILLQLSDDARMVVSEPIGDLPGAWNVVPEASYGVVGRGEDQLRPFKIKQPSPTVSV